MHLDASVIGVATAAAAGYMFAAVTLWLLPSRALASGCAEKRTLSCVLRHDPIEETYPDVRQFEARPGAGRAACLRT